MATVPMLRGHVRHAIRVLHRHYLRRDLPRKLGIYFHSVAGAENKFEEMLLFLMDNGYGFVDPDRFLTETDNVCFVSFDDNYRSWLGVLPILDKYEVRATFYINSWPFRDKASAAEVQRYIANRCALAGSNETTLSTAELQEIAAAGHIIGAHTHTHPVLTAISYDAACAEIDVCRNELASLLARPPEHFAFPYGMRRHFHRSLRSYCRSRGFRTIANAISCMQYARMRPDNLYRSAWFLEQPLAVNLENMCIDGRAFSLLTGRSAIGGNLS